MLSVVSFSFSVAILATGFVNVGQGVLYHSCLDLLCSLLFTMSNPGVAAPFTPGMPAGHPVLLEDAAVAAMVNTSLKRSVELTEGEEMKKRAKNLHWLQK